MTNNTNKQEMLNLSALKETATKVRLQQELQDGPHTVTITNATVEGTKVVLEILFSNGYVADIFETTQKGAQYMVTKLGIQGIVFNNEATTYAEFFQPVIGKEIVIHRVGMYNNLPTSKQLLQPEEPTSTVLSSRPRK